MAIGIIVLDSAPLGLVLQRRGLALGDKCRSWLGRHESAGTTIVVPQIIEYEIRRELLRLGHAVALSNLDRLLSLSRGRRLTLSGQALHRAAELWADARRRGVVTAHPKALDIDVILAAQVLTAGFDMTTTIVATSNKKHLEQFVPADDWQNI